MYNSDSDENNGGVGYGGVNANGCSHEDSDISYDN
jgi:hypothetical protein